MGAIIVIGVIAVVFALEYLVLRKLRGDMVKMEKALEKLKEEMNNGRQR